jgi:hypothetical protein
MTGTGADPHAVAAEPYAPPLRSETEVAPAVEAVPDDRPQA